MKMLETNYDVHHMRHLKVFEGMTGITGSSGTNNMADYQRDDLYYV